MLGAASKQSGVGVFVKIPIPFYQKWRKTQMYYEIGQEFSKTITIDGFKFYMYVAKTEFGVDVTIQDRDDNTVSEITINDVSGMESATDILMNDARTWIDENVDEQDHIMNRLLGGFR